MNVRLSFLISAGLLITCTAAAQSKPRAKSEPAPVAGQAKIVNHPAKMATIQVPAGTRIPLVLENAISTRTAHPGNPVYFETLYPVLAGGRIVIPAGSYMSGHVISAKRSGRIHGRGKLVLKLTQLILPNGYAVNLAGMPSGVGTGGGEEMGKEGQIKGPTSRAADAGVIIRSTVYGAAIGAAAGGVTGAKSGLGVGAVAGLLGILLTRGPDAVMPRGTTMDVVLDHPIALLASRVHFKTPGRAPDLPGPPNRQPRRRAISF